MDTKTTLSISDARKNIFGIIDEVQKPGVHYTFTEKGRPKAVLISAEEYESIMETMEVERIFPDLDKDIAQVKKDIKSGAYKKYSTLSDLKRDWNMVGQVAEKPKKKYGISTHHKTKSKKKS